MDTEVHEVERYVEAPPETVYALVADVERTGEWSPETYRCRWKGGATGPAVGARFDPVGWLAEGSVEVEAGGAAVAALRPELAVEAIVGARRALRGSRPGTGGAPPGSASGTWPGSPGRLTGHRAPWPPLRRNARA